MAGRATTTGRILGGCLILAALVVTFAPRLFPGDVTQKWQYATLSVSRDGNGRGGASWSTGDTRFDNRGALFGKAGDDFPPERGFYAVYCYMNRTTEEQGKTMTLQVLLGNIGDKGWELVSHQGDSIPTGTTATTQTWTFKRPVTTWAWPILALVSWILLLIWLCFAGRKSAEPRFGGGAE